MERSRNLRLRGGRRVTRLLVVTAVLGSVLVPGGVASASDLVVDLDVPTGVVVGEPVTVTAAVSGRAAAGSQRLSIEVYRETAPGSGTFSGPLAGSQVVDTPRTGPTPRSVSISYPAAATAVRDVVVACAAPSARVGANTAETHCRVGDGRTVRPVPRSFAGTSPRVGVSPHDVAVVAAFVPALEIVAVTPQALAPGESAEVTLRSNVPGEVAIDARRDGTDTWSTTPLSGDGSVTATGGDETVTVSASADLAAAVADGYQLRATVTRPSGQTLDDVTAVSIEPVVRDVTPSPAAPVAAAPGADVDVSWVTNVDGADSSRVVLRDGDGPDAAIVVEERVDTVPGATTSTSLTVPADAGSGPYQLQVEVTAADGTTASTAGDRAVEVTRVLTVDEVTPATVAVGGTVSATFTHNVRGGPDASCRAVLVDGDDVELADTAATVADCGAGTHEVELPVPDDTPTGTHRVRVTHTTGPDGTATSATSTATVTVTPSPVLRYVLTTSDDPGGPVYDFVDISATGTRLSISDLDDWSQRVTVPFPITVYDVTTDQLEIGTNGGIQVGPNGEYTFFNNVGLPTSAFVTPGLFPMWDDLNPAASGDIYVATLGTAPERRFVIQYDDVARHSASANGATFQVILFEDRRDVVFQYDDVDFGDARYDFGASATVGVNRDATEATQFSFNRPALRDGLALRFGPPPPPSRVVYFDDWQRPAQDRIHAGLVALDTAGTIDLEVASEATFASLVGSDPDIVYYTLRADPILIAHRALLADHVADGGRLVYTSWTTSLLEPTLQVAAVDANHTSATITDPTLGAGIVSPMTLTSSGWTTFNRGFAPQGDARSLCTFPSGSSCAVLGNGGRTLVLSFLVDTLTPADGAALARNALRTVGAEID